MTDLVKAESVSISPMGDRLLATCSVDRATIDGQRNEERLVAGRVLMTDRGQIVEESLRLRWALEEAGIKYAPESRFPPAPRPGGSSACAARA
jgi:hypothetical protein